MCVLLPLFCLKYFKINPLYADWKKLFIIKVSPFENFYYAPAFSKSHENLSRNMIASKVVNILFQNVSLHTESIISCS